MVFKSSGCDAVTATGGSKSLFLMRPLASGLKLLDSSDISCSLFFFATLSLACTCEVLKASKRGFKQGVDWEIGRG